MDVNIIQVKALLTLAGDSFPTSLQKYPTKEHASRCLLIRWPFECLVEGMRSTLNFDRSLSPLWYSTSGHDVRILTICYVPSTENIEHLPWINIPSVEWQHGCLNILRPHRRSP